MKRNRIRAGRVISAVMAGLMILVSIPMVAIGLWRVQYAAAQGDSRSQARQPDQPAQHIHLRHSGTTRQSRTPETSRDAQIQYTEHQSTRGHAPQPSQFQSRQLPQIQQNGQGRFTVQQRYRPVTETEFREKTTVVKIPEVDPETGKTVMRDVQQVVRYPVNNTRWEAYTVYAPTPGHGERTMKIAQELKRMKEDDDSRESKMDELRKQLSAEFMKRHKDQLGEIKKTEERLESLKTLHRKRLENKDKIVERRIDELLGNPDSLQWNVNPGYPAAGYSLPNPGPGVLQTRAPQVYGFTSQLPGTESPSSGSNLDTRFHRRGDSSSDPNRGDKPRMSSGRANHSVTRPDATDTSKPTRLAQPAPPVHPGILSGPSLPPVPPEIVPNAPRTPQVQPPSFTDLQPNDSRVSNVRRVETRVREDRGADRAFPPAGRRSSSDRQSALDELRGDPARSIQNAGQVRGGPTSKLGEIFSLARNSAAAHAELAASQAEYEAMRKLHDAAALPTSQVNAAKRRLEASRRDVKLIEMQIDALSESMERIVKVAEASLARAKSKQKTANENFKRGLTSHKDLVDANYELEKAELELADAAANVRRLGESVAEVAKIDRESEEENRQSDDDRDRDDEKDVDVDVDVDSDREDEDDRDLDEDVDVEVERDFDGVEDAL